MNKKVKLVLTLTLLICLFTTTTAFADTALTSGGKLGYACMYYDLSTENGGDWNPFSSDSASAWTGGNARGYSSVSLTMYYKDAFGNPQSSYSFDSDNINQATASCNPWTDGGTSASSYHYSNPLYYGSASASLSEGF